jgi:predicted secreted protein
MPFNVELTTELNMKISAVILFSLLFVSQSIYADEGYNRVDFRAVASREVPNDLLNAQMSVEFQAMQASEVANHINRVMNQALQVAKSYRDVKTGSGWQSTYPVYGKNAKLEGWRGSAQLKLESGNFKEASALIGKLQESLHLSGISFTISSDTMQRAENELIAEGIDAFKSRADKISKALGGSTYKIVHININAGNQYPSPLYAARAAIAGATVQQPEFAAGENTVTVQVQGTIEVEHQ